MHKLSFTVFIHTVVTKLECGCLSLSRRMKTVERQFVRARPAVLDVDKLAAPLLDIQQPATPRHNGVVPDGPEKLLKSSATAI